LNISRERATKHEVHQKSQPFLRLNQPNAGSYEKRDACTDHQRIHLLKCQDCQIVLNRRLCPSRDKKEKIGDGNEQ
jgi:hypothetical protein